VRVVALSLVLSLLGGCASAALGARAPATVPGMELRSVAVDGRPRSYRIHRPTGWAGAEPLPVVFAFHGAGSTIDSLARASGFNAMADRERFLVVYPQGLGARFDTRRSSADVRLVVAILAQLEQAGAVDRRRVHATGFSNGGFLCYRLAADMPGVFASIAPVGALLERDVLPDATRVSLMHVHGAADRVVTPGGRRGSYGAQEGVRAWAARAGCAQAPIDQALPGAAPLRVRQRRYACPAGVDVGLLWIEGKGHTWPQEGGGWLSRTMWAFFQDHPLP